MSTSEDVLVFLSDGTRDEFKAVLAEEENRGQVIRLIFGSMGCGGPRLGLALDDPNDAEILLNEDGLVVLADESVRAHIKENGGLSIELVDQGPYGKGFRMLLAKEAEGGCGSGCGSSGGGCSSCGSGCCG